MVVPASLVRRQILTRASQLAGQSSVQTRKLKLYPMGESLHNTDLPQPPPNGQTPSFYPPLTEVKMAHA
jgi:hypothetical protein